MVSLPSHYRSIYLRFIRLACWMALFGLLSGILFQESTRKIPLGPVPPGVHWESVYHLALLHGHIFMVGVLIPLALLGMLHFGLILNGKPLSNRVLHWGGWLYQVGVGLTVLLMLYKGYHYVLLVRMGQLDFAALEHSFFNGQVLLKQIVYGLSHVAMSTGLVIILLGVLRSLPKHPSTT